MIPSFLSLIGFFALAIGISYVMNFVAQELYASKGIYEPMTERSSHIRPVSRSGGLALFISLIACFFVVNNFFQLDLSINFWFSLVIVFIGGIWDDIYKLRYHQKLVVQFAAGLMLSQSGFSVNSLHGLLGVEVIPPFLATLFSLGVFVLVVNAINLVDGIDGLATFLFVLFVLHAGLLMWEASDTILLLVPITIGIVLPFLVFNLYRKKKAILGDSGSMLLGTLVSYILFWMLDHCTTLPTDALINRFILALSLLLYPLLDTLRVFVIRIKNGQHPFKADRNHLHHLLIDRGHTHLHAALSIVLWSDFFLLIQLGGYTYWGWIGAVLWTIVWILISGWIFFKTAKR